MTRSAAIAPLPTALADVAPAPALRPVDRAPTLTPSRSNARRPVWLAIHLRDWQLHATLSTCTDAQRIALADQPLAVTSSESTEKMSRCPELG